MSTSGKRFVIKPLRHHQPMDLQGAQQTWQVLANALHEIYNRNASQLSFEELYRNAYNLVLHKHGSFLYECVSEKIAQHLQDTVQSIVSDTAAMGDGMSCDYSGAMGGVGASSSSSLQAGFMLDRMTTTWQEHLITMTMIRDILMYMDRTYVHQARRRPVYELGLHLFRVTVWDHPLIGPRVVHLVLQAIKEERTHYNSGGGSSSFSSSTLAATTGAAAGSAAANAEDSTTTTTTAAAVVGTDDHDRTAKVKQVLQMLQLLSRADSYTTNVYQDFEQVFLATTQEFYHHESLDYLSHNSASAYVNKASLRLQQEKERAQALSLPYSTEGPLLQIVQTEFIERHAKTLVDLENSGFAALLVQEAGGGGGVQDSSNNKLLEMQQMYDLFVRVPSSVDHLRDALADRIKTDGKQLMMEQSSSSSSSGDPSAFCRGVLLMREKYSTIVQECFRQEKKAQKRLKESFEFFLNFDARAASCLAVYVDELLRTGLRGQSDEVVQHELGQAIVVFRYLSDKDVFESFYKQHLAKRLLGGRSVSDDAERTMVSLLKAECGYQFTTKLEGMFNDMRISRETRDKYKAFKRQEETTKAAAAAAGGSSNSKLPDIEVDVLTTGYWPSQNVPPCTLPLQVQQAIDKFSSFYLEKHTGRKLSWQTSAGAAELKATFGNTATPNKMRKHELCVSTYQMCILLLYNDENTLTLGQIRTKTHIPDMELRRHLISLCTPKNRILKKGSKGRGITSDADTFTYNADYSSKLKRVRIPLVKDSSITPTPGTGTAGGEASGGGGDGAAGGAHGTAAHASTLTHGAVPVAVEEDRRHLVEASIVRIMKARKMLNHNDLIAEVTRQLSNRFQPSPQFIKKRIESLIEREYLERSESEHRVYMYVA